MTPPWSYFFFKYNIMLSRKLLVVVEVTSPLPKSCWAVLFLGSGGMSWTFQNRAPHVGRQHKYRSFSSEVDSKVRTSEAVYNSPGYACSSWILSEPSTQEPIKTASFRSLLLGTLLSNKNNFFSPSISRKVVHKLDRNDRRTCQDLFLQSAQESKTPFACFSNAKVKICNPFKGLENLFVSWEWISFPFPFFALKSVFNLLGWWFRG